MEEATPLRLREHGNGLRPWNLRDQRKGPEELRPKPLRRMFCTAGMASRELSGRALWSWIQISEETMLLPEAGSRRWRLHPTAAVGMDEGLLGGSFGENSKYKGRGESFFPHQFPVSL